MEQCVVSYEQSTRNRGIVNLIGLVVFLSPVIYLAEFGAMLTSLNEASFTDQIFIVIILLSAILIILHLIVLSIRDVLLNSKFGVKLYATHLVFTEPNYWRPKSYKIDYKDIVEIHKEYWSGESNVFYVKTRNRKKYYLSSLKDDLAERALDYLSTNLTHVKVIIEGSKNT